MKTIKIGILGLGTVGSGVYELVRDNGAVISTKSGIEIIIEKVADSDSHRKDVLGIPDELFTTDASEIIESPDIDVIVELIGGTAIAKKLTLKAIQNRKHVVTANKALLATHGREIFEEVLKNGVELGYEASVGGGIPIIKTIREALVGNRVQKIVAILNGTTNFILTSMSREGLDFKEALERAQKLGFAEADPTLDISGGDARHKITILSSLAFSSFVDHDQVYMEGIEHIAERDMEYARELGFVLKLLAIAEINDAGMLVRVHPALVSEEDPLAAISWEDNAVMVYSDYLGKSMYYGKGAGAYPTASAIVADLIDIGRRVTGTSGYNRHIYVFNGNLSLIPFENYVPLVMLTHTARESNLQKAVAEIEALDELGGSGIIIRVIDEENK
jgi:homoserine dehydrogenase